MHYLIKKSFSMLYPEKVIDFDAKIKYSKAFKGYNANVKYTRNMTNFEFRLSYNWKDVSDEIKIGLIQSLINRIFKTRVGTINIDMYEIFLKKIPKVIPITKTNIILEESFNRMNNNYFSGLMSIPNLEFGGRNFRTLGTYSYSDDTIRISTVLKKDMNLLDYVMYHEMLHKKLKYTKSNKNNLHHSPEFRRLEKIYHDKDVEEKLKKFLRKEKLLDNFRFF